MSIIRLELHGILLVVIFNNKIFSKSILGFQFWTFLKCPFSEILEKFPKIPSFLAVLTIMQRKRKKVAFYL
jgi:hypothetical protein